MTLPVAGTWSVIDSPGHDRYAFDLVALDSATGRTLSRSRFQHLIGRVTAADSYSWSQRVTAPAAGEVVRAVYHIPDRHRLSLLKDLLKMAFSRPDLSDDDVSPFAGNHVIIDGGGFYVLLAHLKQNSLTVGEGDQVESGQAVGRVGNSGMTLEPHLHFQLLDQIDDIAESSAPAFRVSGFAVLEGDRWRPKTGAPLAKSQTIRSIIR